MTNLYKRAAAHGVAHELMRRGVVSFPSKEAAEEAADAVAEQMPEEMPEVSGPEGHAPEDVAMIANKLIEIAHALMAQSGGGGAPAPEAEAAAADLNKTAALMDLDAIASSVAVSCMEKAAAEVQKQAGALIQGGDKGNDPGQAAKTTEVGALDEKQRPQGTYLTGQGNTALDTNKGQNGSSQTHDQKPAESPSGSNSVSADANTKAAAMREAVRKIAGALIQGGDKGNTFAQAAQTTEVGALDAKQRPENAYRVSPGGANFSEPQAARVGVEKKHPEAPANSPGGTNSVIQASKAASEDELFMELFRKTAADVGPYLPATLTGEEKLAAVRSMMGHDRDGRQAILDSLYAKVAVDQKKAGDIAEMVQSMKGDEAKEKGEKTSSSLIAEMERIASAAR